MFHLPVNLAKEISVNQKILVRKVVNIKCYHLTVSCYICILYFFNKVFGINNGMFTFC